MKIEQVKLPSSTFSAPGVIATGVQGGGYVSVLGGSPVGTSAFKTDLTQYVRLPKTDEFYRFYLNEGEQLYGRTTYSGSEAIYFVVYHNSEPSSQNNNPLSFTGTINLSQS